MADYTVVTAFRARDHMSKNLKKMGLNAKNFGSIASQSFRRASRSAISFKGIVSGILVSSAIRQGFFMIGNGLRTVVGEFANFDDAISGASAKFNLFDRNSAQFKALEDTAREVGATTEYTAVQAAEGLRFLAKAGWNMQDSMKALPSFVDLATASEMEFARAADIATDVMGAFQLRTDDSAKTLENLAGVNDILSTAVNMSNIDLENLFETIKYAGPVAKTTGVSLREFAAMAAFVGGAGIKGSMGGTAMRTMLIHLAGATPKLRKEFRKIGVDLLHNGKLRKPVAILKDIGAKMKGMSKAQQVATANLLFGKRAIAGASVAIQGASGKIQEFEDRLLAATGKSKKMAAFMRGALTKRFETLKSAALEMGFRILDAFKDRLPKGVDSVTEAIRKFDVKPVVETLKRLIEELKSLYGFMKETKAAFAEHKGLILGIGAAYGAWKIGTIAAGLISVVKSILAIKAAGGVSAAIGAVTGAVAVTVGAIALAVGSVAWALYEVYKGWDQFGSAWEQFWTAHAVPMAMGVGQAISEMFAEVWIDIKNGVITLLKWLNLAFKGSILSRFISADSAIAGLEKSKNTGMLMERAQQNAADQYRRDRFKRKLITDVSQVPTPFVGTASQSIKPMVRETMTPWLDEGPQSKHWNAADKDKELAARMEKYNKYINFKGELNIKGAPQGSTFKDKSKGPPALRANMMGPN